MDSRTLALSVTVLVALGVMSLAVVIVTGPEEAPPFWDDRVPVEDVGGVRSIEYVVNGGSIPVDSPRSYLPGTYTSLPDASNGDLFFEGWYTDPECTVPLGAVVPSMDSDITLYASWSDFDPIGHGMSMDFLIEYGSGPDRVAMTGVMSWTYMTESHGAYYIQRDTVWHRDSGDESDTGGYWTDEVGGSEYRYIGNGEVDGMLCEMWSDGNGECQWIYRNFTVMKIEYERGTNHQLFTLREQIEIVPDLLFSPTVRMGVGVEVESEPVLTIGSEAVFTASGEGFSCWYVNGVSVSSDRVLIVDRVDPNMVIDARSSETYAVVDGEVDPSELGFGSDVSVLDATGKEVASGTGPFVLGTGFYTMESSVDGCTSYRDFLVEEVRMFSHSWSYGGNEYTISLELLYSEVYMDSYLDGDNIRVGLGQEHDSRFLSSDSSYVRQVSDELSVMTAGMDPVSRAGMVLTFVQTIPYLSDQETRGTSEYWKYPSETFWDGGGDCEDSSILYASIMNCMGYTTSVAVFSEHAMAGIVLDGLTVDHDSFTENGVTYVFAETTNTSLGLWKTSSRFQASEIVYVVVS